MMLIDRTQEPPIGDFQDFKIEKPRQYYLENGIAETLFYNPQLELIHFVVKLNCGVLHETQKHLASMCFALLKGAVKGYTEEEVNDFLDYYGVSVDVDLGLTKCEINIAIPHRNCIKVLPFVLNMLLHPLFDREALERQKLLSIKRLEYNQLKESYRATQLMFKSIFGENSFRGTLLTRQHIECLTSEQLLEYYHKIMVADNVELFVSGNVDNSLQKIIADTFSQIPTEHMLLRAERLVDGNIEKWVYEEDKNSLQSSVTLCRRSISYAHKDRRECQVMNVLFGGYFGSRLMQNLREKNGYTYGVFNASMFFGNQSVYYIDSEINVEKTAEAVQACYDEMSRLCEERVNDAELQLVRNYMMGSALRNVDGSIKLMKKYIQWSTFGFDENEFYKMIETIRSIDASRIMELAQIYLRPSDFTSVIVGRCDKVIG